MATYHDRQDFSRPLHVDCSVEYELPNAARPPVGARTEPLLMIHPCYYRRAESQRRSPFINNLPASRSRVQYPKRDPMLCGTSSGDSGVSGLGPWDTASPLAPDCRLNNGPDSGILEDKSGLTSVTVSVTSTEAVAGSTARLQCDITPPLSGDKIHLILWYKEVDDLPIYSVDARGRSPEHAVHWADNATLGGRASFRLADTPARLTLDDVRDGDAGVYRCRVDFKKSPTRNSKVNLTVILPPQRLVVVDERGGGDNIHHYILGPYNEGSPVDITCTSVGGRPLPRVTWWQENALIDDTYEAVADRRVRNVLHLERLERRHLHLAFTCQATNNNYVAPVSTAVSLDINLRPLWVRLQGDNRPLSADQSQELRCEVVGARPPPVISWWKGSIPLRNTKEKTTEEGNVTVSVLQFVPSIEDSGKIVTCRAVTPLIDDSSLEDGWQLNIYHVPIVSLELGSTLNASALWEGMDVYFECNIKSNPWVTQIVWLHNNQELQSNSSGGVLVSNQSLVLQDVTRQRAGRYTCLASNLEGEGESNTVYLDIKYVPVCKSESPQSQGAARGESVRAVCEVEANPSDVQFSWSLVTTAGQAELPPVTWTTDRTRSVLTYSAATAAQYGTLSCRARNALGLQERPCLTHVLPAGKPDPVCNCSVSNQTVHGLLVDCDAGFDGGLSQSFGLEVYDATTQELLLNLSSASPVFAVDGLRPGLALELAVTARNAKGRSDVTTLASGTLSPDDRKIDGLPLQLATSPMMVQLTPLLGVVAGMVLSLVLVALAVLLALKLRARQPLDKCPEPTVGSVESVEKNPDIIPLNNDAICNDVRKSTDSQIYYPVPNTIINTQLEEITYAELALPSGVYTKLLPPQPPPEPLATLPPSCTEPPHSRISSFAKESSV